MQVLGLSLVSTCPSSSTLLIGDSKFICSIISLSIIGAIGLGLGVTSRDGLRMNSVIVMESPVQSRIGDLTLLVIGSNLSLE